MSRNYKPVGNTITDETTPEAVKSSSPLFISAGTVAPMLGMDEEVVRLLMKCNVIESYLLKSKLVTTLYHINRFVLHIHDREVNLPGILVPAESKPKSHVEQASSLTHQRTDNAQRKHHGGQS